MEVRGHTVNWQSYLQGQMIQTEDFEVIREFDRAKTTDARQQVLERRGDEVGLHF